MPDLLLSATAADSGIAVCAAITTELVGEIRRRHDLAPTATAAVGRLATGAVLLGANLKGRERLSLQIAGDGPIGALTAEAWLLDETTIGARAYAKNPHADLPIDARGKFDVSGALGSGVLQVTKSYEVGQPYVGVVSLTSGEIAEDLAAYFGQSEQIPSVVALGVLANPAGVMAAGGLVAQVLPGAADASVERLERRALDLPPVTAAIAGGADAAALLTSIGGEGALRSRRSMQVRFACFCTKEKVEAALLGLGRDELARMNQERDVTEATCEFCRHVYTLSRPEVQALIDRG